jgi:hypothetical protein
MADTQSLIVQKSSANTPSIASATLAIASNAARSAWSIQNLGTNTLYVLLGSNGSTTVFHFALKGGSVNDDGTGGSINQTSGVVYTGNVSVYGTSPRYTVMETS